MSFIPVMAKLFFQHPSFQKTIIIIIENSFETVMIFFLNSVMNGNIKRAFILKTMSMSHYKFYFF